MELLWTVILIEDGRAACNNFKKFAVVAFCEQSLGFIILTNSCQMTYDTNIALISTTFVR